MPDTPPDKPTPEAAPKRRGRGRPFTKGDPRIAPLKRKAEANAPPPAEEPDGLDDARRFRLVWEQPPSADCNEAQRRLRKMLNYDPMGFFKTMHQLEQKAGGAADPNTLPPDEGEERVRKLMKELLDAADRGAAL